MARLSPDITVMIKAAEKAARNLVRDFGEVEQLQVSKKGPGDFVSAADRRAEEIIHDELSYARPDFGFLMEESGIKEGKNAESRFIVDPLDGTTNFLHGIPHWAISIALETKGEIVAGIVYDPIKDEMFRAEKNNGAFVNSKRLRVSGRTDLSEAVMGTGQPRRAVDQQAQFMKEYAAMTAVAPGMRRFGAASLDLCYVAAGRLDGFWERNLKSWDVASGILIVRESGGFVNDLNDDRNNPVISGNVVASNDALFSDIKKVLKAV